MAVLYGLRELEIASEDFRERLKNNAFIVLVLPCILLIV